MGIHRFQIGFSFVQNLITDPALFIIFCCYFSLIIKLRAEKLWIANTRLLWNKLFQEQDRHFVNCLAFNLLF